MSRGSEVHRRSLMQFVELLEEHQVGPAHRCPYLPDREARVCGFVAESLSASFYHGLMDHGFRRSGRLFYRPSCAACRECIQLRVPVAEFRPQELSTGRQRVSIDTGSGHVKVEGP